MSKRFIIQRNFLLIIFFILMANWKHAKIPFGIQSAYASVTVTTATGGLSVSADNTGGSYTILTGPTITESSHGDFPSSGTIILSVPSGFIFNTGANVTATISKDAGTGTCFTFTSTTAVPTTTKITFTASSSDSRTNTHCHVTFSNIQIRPSSGTPLATGSIADTGTALVSGLTSSTDLGDIGEVAGAKNKLAITTQPSSTAVVSTNFATNPVVALEDQFGNIETSDSTSTISEAVVLSSSSCGGTAGSGTLTSTPASGTAVANGLLTYTAMQYSVAENIKICFSSSAVTSVLSNSITVGIVSISISSSGVVSYGYLPVNSTKDTTASGLNDTQIAQNTGTIAEDFNIEGQNSADWTLASTNGLNQYIHSFSTNGGSTWTALTTSFQSLGTNIAANGTKNFDLQITTPTSTSNYSQQSVNVTIEAVAH